MKSLAGIKLKTFLVFPPVMKAIKMPPLGIAQIAGYLRSLGYSNYSLADWSRGYRFDHGYFQVNLEKYSLQFAVDSALDRPWADWEMRVMREMMEKEKPDVVGFSILFPEQLFSALKAARMMKKLNPRIFVVLGGSVITRQKDDLLKTRIKKLADALVVGEGEESMARILEAIHKKKKPAYVWQAEKKELFTVPDFTGLDPDRALFLPLLISKGCYWGRCVFCTYHYGVNAYRVAPPEKVAEGFRIMRERYGNKKIAFLDDALPPAYLESLAGALIESGVKTKWSCNNLCLDPGFLKPDLLAKVRKSGCYFAIFGFESASPGVVKAMNKMHDPKTALAVLKAFHENKIGAGLYVMLGFPGDTRRDTAKTLDFLKTHCSLYDMVVLNRFLLSKGSSMHENPSAYSLKVLKPRMGKDYIERGGYDFSSLKPVMGESEMAGFARQIRKLVGEKFSRFKSHYTEYEEIMKSLKSRTNPKNIEGMRRFGIKTENALGVPMPYLRKLGKEIGKSKTIALELWRSSIHEARILASIVAEPDKMKWVEAEKWVREFDSWDVCDQTCMNLLRRMKGAPKKAAAWTRRKEEFVRRAGFALMAALAADSKNQMPDADFKKFLPLIEKYSTDERNFVRKAVNWALRQIGKRNKNLNKAALALAFKIAKKDSKPARWIAADAIRELESGVVQKRLK